VHLALPAVQLVQARLLTPAADGVSVRFDMVTPRLLSCEKTVMGNITLKFTRISIAQNMRQKVDGVEVQD
jgi:hypothetical protein